MEQEAVIFSMRPDGIILDCANVHKSYFQKKTPVRILKGVNLVLKAGSITVVRGRSGAGKSTLLNLLGALDDPTSGSIMFCGVPYQQMTEREFTALRRGGVAHIHQDFNLIESWTAIENVVAALMCRGLGWRESEDLAATSLNQFGLSRVLENFPSEMSAGEQQRVAAVRALMQRPRLILADEPTGSVDQEAGNMILRTLIEYANSQRTALLIATHNNSISNPSCNVYSLEDGVLVRQAREGSLRETPE